jgi:hypothetical protein
MSTIEKALRIAREAGGLLKRPRVERKVVQHVGPIHSSVAGRTDHLPMHVPSGSYVLPADIISASGEGNTIAGFKHAKRVFGGTPYGAHSSNPYDQGSTPYGMASGGAINPSDSSTDSEGFDTSQVWYKGMHPYDWTQEKHAPGKPIRSENVTDPGPLIDPRDINRGTGFPTFGGTQSEVPNVRGFFTSDPRVASHFATSNSSQGAVFPVYLKHKNPYVIDAKGKKASEIQFGKGGSEWQNAVASGNHDAVLIKNTSDEGHIATLLNGSESRSIYESPRPQRASGGHIDHGDEHGVPIVAAGGEFVLSPDQVREAGGGDLDMGHKVLDEFVLRIRRELIKTLKNLPGPKRD